MIGPVPSGPGSATTDPAAAQEHVVSTGELRQAIVTAAEKRRDNLETIREFFRTDAVRGAIEIAPGDPLLLSGVMRQDQCRPLWMLVGEPPFVANSTPAMLVKHISERPTPVTQRRADVPVDLGRAVMMCLEKDPAMRFPSASAMVTALDTGKCDCATVARIDSATFTAAVFAPSGNPITVQTFTLEPLRSRAHKSTHVGFTHTEAKPCLRASKHNWAISCSVASGLRRV